MESTRRSSTGELFDAVQRLRRRRSGARLVQGGRGVLQGRIGCIRCGTRCTPIASTGPDCRCTESATPSTARRTTTPAWRAGRRPDAAAVRARSRFPTTGGSASLPLAAKRGCKRVDVASLQERKRRVVQIHEDGGYANDAEYKAKLAEIDGQIRTCAAGADREGRGVPRTPQRSVGAVEEATSDERSRLIAPLIERVYIDVETRWVAAITPAEGFGLTAQESNETAGLVRVLLAPCGSCEPARLVDLVETGEN